MGAYLMGMHLVGVHPAGYAPRRRVPYRRVLVGVYLTERVSHWVYIPWA
jgi:hypothetical protein